MKTTSCRERHIAYVKSRTDWPKHWRAQLLREIELVSDETLADSRSLSCVGKHWVPRYVPIGRMCHYCGWTKARREAVGVRERVAA